MCQNGNSLWGYCRESDAPHRDGVNDLRSHSVLCSSKASTVFCLSHLHFIPSRLGSYKVVPILYRDVSVFAGHVFPLRPHGHNVSWFPDVDPRTANLPRECADLPRWMSFCFKTFMQLIHSYVLISQKNLQTRASSGCFTTKWLEVQIEQSSSNLSGCNGQQRCLNSLLTRISVINLKMNGSFIRHWTNPM